MAEWDEGERMAKRAFRNWRITRFVIGRKRLLLSSMAGLILLPLLPDDLRVVTRLHSGLGSHDRALRRLDPLDDRAFDGQDLSRPCRAL